MVTPQKKLILLLIIGIIAGAFVVKSVFFRSEFRYAGTIEATKVAVPSRLSSVIASLDAKEGDRVQAGQTLLKMSCEDYALNAKLADDNHARAQQLLKEGSLSQQDYDAVKNKKEEADLKVSWCDVKSPLTATVLTKYHEAGEMVTPGTKLFTLADIKDIYAYIYVPQPRVADLRLLETITGYLPEMKDRTFEGTITWISEEAEFTPKNVQTQEERSRLVYAVKIALKNDDEILKPGMTIEVSLPKK